MNDDARNVDVPDPPGAAAVAHIADTLDVHNPTEVDRAALRAALRAPAAAQTILQSALVARYMAATCPDCVDGRCHPDRRRRPGSPCTCARHLVSSRWRLS